MMGYISDNNSNEGLFDEEYFRQLAIELSSESIANLRKELDEMKD